MNNKNILYNFGIKPDSIRKKGSVSIITSQDKKYVLKKKNRKVDLFDYLATRNFGNFPVVYSSENNDYYLTDYVEDKNTPKEQKLEDIVYLSSILHTKTTFYKQVDDDYIKDIYETLLDKQNNLYNYYNDLQDMIELEIYMSPGNYLLIRNISLIYLALRKSNQFLESWYSKIKETKKIRYSYIHGNLDESHLIENVDLYLISWDKSRIDLPIYDLEKLYRNSFNDIDLENILTIYESKYPLKKEEYDLLLALLLIPDKIDMIDNEYNKTKQVTSLILYLEKILTYLKNNTKETNYYHNHQE